LHRPTFRFVLIPMAILAATVGAAGADDTVTRAEVMAALPQLEALAGRIIGEDGVPGLSIAVVYKDEVVDLKGFGVREAGKPEPVDGDTVFQVASMSKPISATIVAALVSDGAVAWDSRIADIDPGFRLHDAYPSAEVTVRDLFNHRSGLWGDAGNDLETIGFERDEILSRLWLLKPSSSFRAGYAYSNFGITEGAVAAARAAGMSWEDAADAKLYKPLGMASSSSRYRDFLARANRAELHVEVSGKWTALVKRDPDPQSPGGGVSASARDLAEWMRLVLANGKYGGRQLIDEAAMAETHVPLMQRGKNPVTGAQSFYGLGWNVEFGRYGLMWGHAGAFSQGARSTVSLEPANQLGIVVLANAFPSGVPEGIADSFFDLVHTGHITKDWLGDWNAIFASMFGPAIEAAKARYGTPPKNPTAALPLAAYLGKYANDYVGEVEVAESNGGLILKLGPKLAKFLKLTHYDRDLFTYAPFSETPDMPYAVSFAIGADQKAREVRIEDLDGNGQGVLVRAGE